MLPLRLRTLNATSVTFTICPILFSNLYYHLVWIPKRRKKILIGDVEKRLRQIAWEVCQEKDWQVIALEIMPDHVHLFVNVPPDVAAHKVANAIKGRSSRLLRQEF